MDMKPLYIDVKEVLDKPGVEMSFSGPVALEPTKLGRELIEFPVPVEVDLILRNVSQGVIIEGKAAGRLTLRCSRCLERFDYLADIAVEELAAAGEAADEVFPIQDGKIDIAAVVYQNIMVQVPIQPLCREACAGLCATCGKNLNEEPHEHPKEEIDERLAGLRKYFKKEQG